MDVVQYFSPTQDDTFKLLSGHKGLFEQLMVNCVILSDMRLCADELYTNY